MMHDLVFIAILLAITQYHSTRFNLSSTIRDRRRGAQTITDWLERPFLLYRGTGLKRQTFYDLITWLRVETGLRDSRYMRLEEKLAIFLHICRTGAGSDNTELVFGRAPDTVSRSALFYYE
jgi:hypothetical protein